MRYRTKVRTAEAFRWQGQPRSVWPAWATPELLIESGSALYAYTKNAPVRAMRGDWLILGGKEIYPCKDEEFNKRYERDTPAGVTTETTFAGVRDSQELDDGA